LTKNHGKCRRVAGFVLALCGASTVNAGGQFDLAGPAITVTVSRGTTTLPISKVPNLAPGDRLWIKAELPPTQSENYLMVAAFLRGATNPPPGDWFFRSETWKQRAAQQGLTVTVPRDAQQMLLFLAPHTSGDFRTLVDAVRGRPGAFVRASQDLNQASLDRSRLTSYLAAVIALDQADPARLKVAAPLLARSLAIKVDEKCLDRIPELRASCLMQGQDSLILNDGHSTSIVEALTSGPASDLAMEASYTPQLSYGYYSPYLASVLDIARIFASFHTAQYQYIPALSSPQGDQLALTLNTPPSFHNPKSVLVTALPAVEDAQLPPLHAVDPKEVYCAGKTAPVFPVEGAPLVFSTAFAHDMVLSLTGKDGRTIDLPAKADAQRGGLVVDTAGLTPAALGDSIRGSLHGYWGFDEYAGPVFQLVNSRAQTWALASGDEGSLIVGREDTVHLRAGSVSCLERVMLKDPQGNELTTEWKAVKPDEVELKLPLREAKPGAVTLVMHQYGPTPPQPMQLQTFTDAGRRDKFSLFAGEAHGILKGSRLDEVASLMMKGVRFLPAAVDSSEPADELPMQTDSPSAAAALKQGDTTVAKVALKDGRIFDVRAVVNAPRPRVTLIGKSVQMGPLSNGANIQLADAGEFPQDAKLTFSVRLEAPMTFGRDTKIEVATADDSFLATLSSDNGGLMDEDRQVAIATLDPAKAFGPSASGALQFRVMTTNAASDWQPLATLVRLPTLKELTCPATAELACKLSGSNLFLVDWVSSSSQFDHAVQVPEGFPGDALPVPRPPDGRLYLKLHDAPKIINAAQLTVRELPPSAAEVLRASALASQAKPVEVKPVKETTDRPAAAAGPGSGAMPPPPRNDPPVQAPAVDPQKAGAMAGAAQAAVPPH
jgi:hypothetical protein